MASIFESDDLLLPRQGTVFEFRPVFWIEPPITIVRDINYISRRAWIYRESEWPTDAFRRGSENNQENVIARAKIRYVVILSPDHEAAAVNIRELIVAPIYSLGGTRLDIAERIKTGEWPDRIYLETDQQFPDLGESFINFRQVQPMQKDLLGQQHKQPFRFNSDWRDAIIKRYRDYFVYRAPPATA